MGYSIYVVSQANKNKYEHPFDAGLFDGEDKLEPFSVSQTDDLRKRLARYGFVETSSGKHGSELSHPRNSVSALVTGRGLYFRAALDQDNIFEASMIASEFTDSGDFAKFDPQEGGWEVV